MIPLSIVDWEETATVWFEFNVFVFESATVLVTVAKILILCPAKLAPKSKFKVLWYRQRNWTND